MSGPFFTIPAGSEWNAFSGEQTEPILIAEGYVKAALKLATTILQQNLFGDRDTFVMPVLFGARHGVELYLKLYIGRLAECGVITETHPVDHDIDSHYRFIRDRRIPDARVRNLLKELEPYVADLARLDPDGQAFRYATDRDGNATMSGQDLVNIAVVAKALGELHNLLEQTYWRIDALVVERRTVHTDLLSYADLRDIARRLPLHSTWAVQNADFLAEKARICSDYDLSSNSFAKAVDAIKSDRELGAMIGMTPLPMAHLTEETCTVLLKAWDEWHTRRDDRPRFVDVADPQTFEQMVADSKRRADISTGIRSEIDRNDIADAKAIFYLARDKHFASEYDSMVEHFEQRAAQSANTEVFLAELLGKTNFRMKFIEGLARLGNGELADRLST